VAQAPLRIERPQRWDVPFGAEMTGADVERLLAREPFSRMDPRRFPPGTPLAGILLNDARILRYGAGDLVVREGDYGSSAFFVLGGAVRVVIDDLPRALLGRREPRRIGWWGALRQLWAGSRVPEARRVGAAGRPEIGAREDEGGPARIFLQDVPGVLDRHRTVRLSEGEMFGEIAALGRTPRTATVFAEDRAELLEIRWQGLRELRGRDDVLREYVERRYRERSLVTHLSETELLAHLDAAALARVAAATSFESYGRFDWYATYRALAGQSAERRLADEPVIAEEGHYPNGLVLIRAGFARTTRAHGHGQRTLGYVGKGGHHGFAELAHNWRGGTPVPLQHTLRAVGYVDVLRVPTPVVEREVLPGLPARLLPPRVPAAPLGTDVLEFLVENRLVNGTAAMLIDLDRCTRCDDCVRACAAAHDGNPRFLRQGPRIGPVMVAQACMHCADPVCMIGCPTGAIHRDPLRGQVLINDQTCIGCSTCAGSCPYGNIQMVELRDSGGRPLLDQRTHAPALQATKCDLCAEQLGGPACARACPHDALARIDLTRPEPLARWLAR